MRASSLVLACFAALSGLPAGAQTEMAREQFDRLVNEPGNTDFFGYADASITGPVLVDGVPFADSDEAFGMAALATVQRATRGGIADSLARSAFGELVMNNQALRSGAPATADSSGGFRDFWTFGGGTGTGTLEVRGIVLGDISGDGPSRFNPQGTLSTTGSFGQTDASYAASFEGTAAGTSASTQCGAAFDSECETSGSAMLWSLTLPFEYGGSASFVQRLSSGTESIDPNPLGLLEVRSSIIGIVLPEGATLTAASNLVRFSDGMWIYTDRPVMPPIPEPATWGLMVAGLVVLAGIRSRGRRR